MPPDARTHNPGRIAIYVQHLLGTGHYYRAAAIAGAAAGRGHTVLLITGGEPVAAAAPAGVTVVQLPPIRARAAGDWSLVTVEDVPVSDKFWKTRREAMLAAAADFRPEVVLVEHFPFGRRAFSSEILALLDRSRRLEPGLRVAASVRDIIQPPRSAVRAAEIAALLERQFGRVLVHGEPALVSLGASFPESRRLGALIRYTGYIDAAASRDSINPAGARRGVLVSAGGGRAGADLLRAVLDVRNANPLADEPWTVIAGRGAAAEIVAELHANLRPGDAILDHADDFRARLRTCRLSISQAGYNTAVDLMTTETPAILVPYAEAGEREQGIRAAAMAAAGLPVQVAPGPNDLAGAIGRAGQGAGTSRAVDRDGLRKTVDALEALLPSAALVDA